MSDLYFAAEEFAWTKGVEFFNQIMPEGESGFVNSTTPFLKLRALSGPRSISSTGWSAWLEEKREVNAHA